MELTRKIYLVNGENICEPVLEHWSNEKRDFVYTYMNGESVILEKNFAVSYTWIVTKKEVNEAIYNHISKLK